MSDDQSWQPPDGASRPQDTGAQAAGGAAGEAGPAVPPGPVPPASENPPTPQYPQYPPQYGAPPYGSPQYGAPQYGQPQYGPPPGWTPPPKPGLIPLRPIGFGTLMSAPFQVLRRNPKPTFGSAVLIQAVVLIASLVVVGGVSALALARIGMAQSADVDSLIAGSVTMILLSALVPIILGLIGSAFLQGVIVTEVARGTVGEKLGMRGLWRGIVGRRLALIGWVCLVAVAVVLAIAVLGGIVTGLVLLGTGGIVAGVLSGLLGGLVLVVVAVSIGTKLSLVPSIIVLERSGIRTAIGRSWMLTNGFFWRTFGVQALISVILGIATQIVTVPISLIYSFAAALIDPTDAGSVNGTAIVVTIVSYLVLLLVSLVIGSVTAIVQSATTALIYIDLRMRKEGLDLTLIRFVEARQTGTTSYPNPFAAPASASPTA